MDLLPLRNDLLRKKGAVCPKQAELLDLLPFFRGIPPKIQILLGHTARKMAILAYRHICKASRKTEKQILYTDMKENIFGKIRTYCVLSELCSYVHVWMYSSQ